MSKNEVNDNLINNYFEPQKNKHAPLKPLKINKKTGKTLDDFYSEVQGKQNTYAVNNIYHGKNAAQIQTMMMQNRKLIEANYTKR